MSDGVTAGVVGGYGESGKVVVTELWKSTPWRIRIGGRNLMKAQAVASEFDQRVSAAPLDVLNAASLDDFCGQCFIVINCGGPVCVLQDRVAQSAFRNRCHYVDPAGMSFVKERMSPHDREIRDLGLCLMVSAGWMPGLTELLPIYAHALARTKMDSINSVKVYFGDSGQWSTSALRDMVFFLRQRGLRNSVYCHKGSWTRAKAAASVTKSELGAPIGAGRFSLMFQPELEEMAGRFTDCDLFSYSYMPSLRIALAGMSIIALPLPEDFSLRLLRYGFGSMPLAVGGFVVVKVNGLSQGNNARLTAQIVYDKHLDYSFHGSVLAAVARIIVDGKIIHPGVHFLADAGDPLALMAELRNAGIAQTERFETDHGKMNV